MEKAKSYSEVRKNTGLMSRVEPFPDNGRRYRQCLMNKVANARLKEIGKHHGMFYQSTWYNFTHAPTFTQGGKDIAYLDHAGFWIDQKYKGTGFEKELSALYSTEIPEIVREDFRNTLKMSLAAILICAASLGGLMSAGYSGKETNLPRKATIVSDVNGDGISDLVIKTNAGYIQFYGIGNGEYVPKDEIKGR